MAEQASTSGTQRPVFRRYTALQVLQEVMNDPDSDDEDMRGEDDSGSDEEETDYNLHHPLLQVGDESDDEDYEPDRDVSDHASTESDSTMDSDEPSSSSPPSPILRGRGRGHGRGRGNIGQQRGGRGRRGRGRGPGRQSDLVTEWTAAGVQPPNPGVVFTGNPGIKVNTDNFSAVDYMDLYFDDLVNHLVIQTNLYAEQYLQAHPDLPPNSGAAQWVQVDAAEMKRFLALILLMGIVRLPSIELYWSKKVHTCVLCSHVKKPVSG
ncbi:hypothetical protein BaRGS_00014373 [Batillaria attramentaria]|uniref:PiggyBac transposable element-derived protein domain-containing protein n=1 Tax=Batillaria attramentaria TaxID=370345 RepID=A0ABD0L5G0_9CAEN